VDAQDAQAVLREAIAALSRGNLIVADFLAQDVLVQLPEHPLALNIVGAIAAQIGLRDKACACFRKALAAAPDFALARANLEKALATSPPRATEGPRFLLIRDWGFGFWADVTHVLACLLLAEISGRTPVTHWAETSLFSDGSGRDAFRLYFQPVTDLRIESIPKFEADEIFPRKWAATSLLHRDPKRFESRGPAGLHLLNRPEQLVVSDYYIGVADLVPWIPDTHAMHGRGVTDVFHYLIGKYLHPTDDIAGAVEAFAAEHFRGKPTTAVHVRGSDKHKEFVDLKTFNRSYFAEIELQDPARQIFLLSDDARILAEFRARYGDRVVATDSHRSETDHGPHYRRGIGGVKLGRDVMIDSYLALRCDSFIGNGRSNVTAMIALLRNWPERTCTLLAPSQLLERNTFLYA
jgi:protein O-GlcNAc transferase